MNPRLRTLLVWLGLIVTLVVIGLASIDDTPTMSEAELAERLAEGRVVSWSFGDEGVLVDISGDQRYRVVAPSEQVWGTLEQLPMVEPRAPLWATLATTVLPLVLLIAALLYFIRHRQRAAVGNVLTLRNHTARQLAPGTEKTRFSDVGGNGEAKERLSDVVDWLRDPRRWQSAGARPPRGVLLEGPPGSGKTLLARAIAGEAGVPVFVASGSEFVEMFVGIGAARVRDLFAAARKAAPAVVFIDELDAIGRRRGSGVGTGHDEREATLNQLLVALDGFEGNERVVVVAATNRVDVLDKALLRPGRFDVFVTLPEPAEADRVEILRIHTRGKVLAADVDVPALAARTAGWTGAALEHLCNDATLDALRRTRGAAGPVVVGGVDFEAALGRSQRGVAGFDQLDAVLLDSASQLARPSGPARLLLELVDGQRVEGELLWADAAFLKLKIDDTTRIVPKRQVRAVSALAGTGAVVAEEVVGDRWTRQAPDVA